MTYQSFVFCPSCCSFTTRFSSKGPLTVCSLGLWPGSSPHSSNPSTQWSPPGPAPAPSTHSQSSVPSQLVQLPVKPLKLLGGPHDNQAETGDPVQQADQVKEEYSRSRDSICKGPGAVTSLLHCRD